MTTETLARQHDQLTRYLGGIICRALDDPDVKEIMCNPDGTLWLETRSIGMHRCNVTLSEGQRFGVISTIASLLDTVATRDHALVPGELPFTRHRFQGIVPPVSPGPMFVIRKHLVTPLTIEEYVHDRIITQRMADLLTIALDNKKTIVISGATDSGKTTLANALLATLVRRDALSDRCERIVVLEDTGELHCDGANVVTLKTSPTATLRALVSTALRLRPDRLIVGEVRGAEALELLKAWNTGHDGGLTTLHANSTAAVFDRLCLLVQEAGLTLAPGIFSGAVDLLVHLTKTPEGRRVTEMARVVEEDGGYTLCYLVKEGIDL